MARSSIAFGQCSARVIHGGSSRNRAVAWRDGRVEPRGTKAYLKQYVEGLSGEPTRLHAVRGACRLVAAANPRLQQKRSWIMRAGSRRDSGLTQRSGLRIGNGCCAATASFGWRAEPCGWITKTPGGSRPPGAKLTIGGPFFSALEPSSSRKAPDRRISPLERLSRPLRAPILIGLAVARGRARRPLPRSLALQRR